jgi:hypothetical protein
MGHQGIHFIPKHFIISSKTKSTMLEVIGKMMMNIEGDGLDDELIIHGP